MSSLRSLLVAAALATSVAPAQASDKITLDFPTYQLQQSFGPWWQDLVAEYAKKYPNREINLTNSPSNDHHANLATRFIGGNPPDIVHMTARFMWGHVTNDFLEPLDTCIAGTDIREQWIPAQKLLEIDGKHYGLLNLTYAWALFYNKAMLEKANVPVPKTLADFMAAAKKLTLDVDKDGRTDQYGVTINTAKNSWGFVEFMHFHAARDRDIVIDGKLDSVSEIQRTLEIIDTLVKSGASPAGLDNNPKRQLFWSGKAAMYIDGSWAPGFAKSRASEAVVGHWAVAPLPFKNMAGGPSNILAIAKGISPERKAAACDFIKLAASPEWQQKYATVTGNPAGRKNSVTDEARKKWPELAMFESAAAGNSRSHMPIGLENDFNEFAAIVMDGVSSMLTVKDVTPEVAAKAIHGKLQNRFFEK